MKYKKYDKNLDYSYTLGQFPTIELINSKKAKLLSLILSDKLIINKQIEEIINYAKNNNVEVITSAKLIQQLSPKDNCYLIGVFSKYKETLNCGNHVVLVSPTDSGNVGTIIRTMLGLNINNLAIIENGKNTNNTIELHKNNTSIDVFNPKVIRASMGSIFSINIEYFENFADYGKKYKNNYYAFCLESQTYLQDFKLEKSNNNFSLVFGNEATGLPKEIIDKCYPIKIRQSNNIDSFNLSISVAMGLYEITKQKENLWITMIY